LQISQAIFDIEEATEEAFDIILAHKAIKSSETSASFIRFLQLLVAHHPSRRCRTGSAEILVNFDDICPSGECSYDQESGAKDSLRNFHICGKDVPRGYYVSATQPTTFFFRVLKHRNLILLLSVRNHTLAEVLPWQQKRNEGIQLRIMGFDAFTFRED
jgi:hypothetical protein